MAPCIALAGPPNCGKTTLFNGLTGGTGKVANHAGVTVETSVGSFNTPSGIHINVLDLPGTHGLSARSADARVAIEAMENKFSLKPDLVVIVVDMVNLRTHLQTAIQILGIGKPAILALNMADLAERDGIHIDIKSLSESLGIPVIPVRATRSSGRAQLIAQIESLIASHPDEPTLSPVGTRQAKQAQVTARNIARTVILAEPNVNRATRHIDNIVLHPLAGPAIFLGLLFAMFQAVFSWATPFMDAIENTVGWIGASVTIVLPDGFLRDFLVDGVIAGVGAVIVFLPQILILFTFILILEGTGYLARAAFLADELMRRIGLSGQAVIPLLSSFACAIPGIMATRTIRDEHSRMITILIAPLMTCSARLPVYALLIAAFIPEKQLGWFSLQGVVLWVLYLAGIVAAVLASVAMRLVSTNRSQSALMLDLPTYKMPRAHDVLTGLRQRTLVFIRRAGGIVLMTSVVVWTLTALPPGRPLPESLAGRIGSLLEPILKPIGFNTEISIALIPGLLAREVAVGALAVVYGTSDTGLTQTLAADWSLATALALLAWYVFAPQCLATFAAMRRETNSWAITLGAFTYLIVMAYVAAGLTFHAARAFGLS